MNTRGDNSASGADTVFGVWCRRIWCFRGNDVARYGWGEIEPLGRLLHPESRATRAAGIGGRFYRRPSSIRSWLGLFLTSVFLWVACGEARQPDLHLAGELQTQGEVDALAGRSIDVVFYFIDAEPDAYQFSADFHQVAGTLAARIPKEIRPVASPAESGSVVKEIRLPLELPRVERETTFLLRLMARRADAEIWHVTGRATVRVHPEQDGVPATKPTETSRQKIP